MRLTVGVTSAIAAITCAGCGGVSLETRTFELRYLGAGAALELIEPYVYSERDGAPGRSSGIDGAITVRETADNLDRIGRVLERYDVSPPSVALSFQLIIADGAATSDPRIAEVEEELRKLFRFDGYQLLTETVVTTLAGRGFNQAMFSEAEPSVGSRFELMGGVGPIRGGRDSLRVELEVNLENLLGASVSVPLGHTVVLGTTRLPESRAIILTVRADLTATP